MMEKTDHTPKDFNPAKYREYISLKRKILDKFVYPISSRISTRLKSVTNPEITKLSFSYDQLLIGERNSGFLSQISILRGFTNLENARVLIQGCGLGQESIPWSKQKVASIAGIDLFDFSRGWQQVYQYTDPEVKVNLLQGDMCNSIFESQSFDIIYSGAVWEHVKDFDRLVQESARLIKPKGIVVAGFGPLWYGFGGDHFSGSDDPGNGYNHILLNQSEYFNWLDSLAPQDAWANSDESYFEIRRHIKEGLFTYLKPREYIEKVERYFARAYTVVQISPEALIFKSTFPEKWQQLLAKEGLLEEDLLIKSLILFLQRKL